MLRSYYKTLTFEGGMNLDVTEKRDGECLYLINLTSDIPARRRRGNSLWSPGPISGTSWSEVNGGHQFIFPQGTADAPFGSMVVGCADDPSVPVYGGKVFQVSDTTIDWLSVPVFDSTPDAAAWLARFPDGIAVGDKYILSTTMLEYECTAIGPPITWTATGSAPVVLSTGPEAKYQWAEVHGKLYGINGYCHPFVVSPLDTSPTKFALVNPVDGFNNSALHVCLLDMPTPRMIGSYNSRPIFGNFQAGAGPYATTAGSFVINQDGPLQVLLGEAITDLDQNVVIQIKESFVFAEAKGQKLVGQYEYQDKNVFWCSGSVWQLIGSTADEYYAIPLTRTTGCVAALTIKETPVGMVWMAYDGFYLFDGSSVKKISDKIDLIFGEMLYSYSANPYMLNRSKLWDACARVDLQRGVYEAWVPLAAYDNQRIKFEWNWKRRSWSIHGKAVYTSDNVSNTEERGENARVAWMNSDSDGVLTPMFGGVDGWIHRGRADCKDDYVENLVLAASTATIAKLSTTTYPYFGTTTADDWVNGMTVVMLDDRTTAEQSAGTWPESRIAAGTTRTVSDSAYNAGSGTYQLTHDTWGQAPQTGALIALWCPVACLWLDELGTDSPSTEKSLRSLAPRLAATSNSQLLVAYEGNPTDFNPDVSFVDNATPRKLVTLSNASTGAVTDIRIGCGPSRNNGRKIKVALEHQDGDDFQLHSIEAETVVKGYK